jgi:hypothetical protein
MEFLMEFRQLHDQKSGDRLDSLRGKTSAEFPQNRGVLASHQFLCMPSQLVV